MTCPVEVWRSNPKNMDALLQHGGKIHIDPIPRVPFSPYALQAAAFATTVFVYKLELDKYEDRYGRHITWLTVMSLNDGKVVETRQASNSELTHPFFHDY
jgi:hypothetical protein